MNKENSFLRLLILLFLTTLIGFGLYFLPDKILGYDIKKVDFLSDLRTNKDNEALLDSLRKSLENPQLPIEDTKDLSDSLLVEGMDSIVLAERDSLYKLMSLSGDSTLISFEDYTVGHTGLKKFYDALNNCHEENRPVRIGFLGDSFIEGDIIVGEFRSDMQNRFGGRGVGFLPVSSVAESFRPTIKQSENGWKSISMLTEHNQRYWLSGMLFEPEKEKASISLELTNHYAHLMPVNSLKFIYKSNADTHLTFYTDKDSVRETLPQRELYSQFEFKQSGLQKISLDVNETKDLQVLGVALEDDKGVIVDNFSLRGNSGIIMGRLDSASCLTLNEVRPYQLLVLQYGLNVASDSTMHYGWYAQRMESVVRHIKRCFPEADILLMGVSDRSHQRDGNFETMPAVLALLHAQRQLAQRLHIVFWNTFAAMGGENSMVRYVDRNWASKDYTHISFRGGKEISKSLIKAILHEKEFYDKASNINN